MLSKDISSASSAIFTLILFCRIIAILSNHNFLVVLAHLNLVHAVLASNGSLSSFRAYCLMLFLERFL